MSTATTIIHATPIMSVGIEGVHPDQIQIIPFYMVNVHDGPQVKRLFVNFTFGKRTGKGIEFGSDLAELKIKQLGAIEGLSQFQICVCQGDTEDRVTRMATAAMTDAPHDSAVLLVIDKDVANDVPFFRALNILQKNADDIDTCAKPVSLSQLGLTIKPPFIESESMFAS